MGRDHSLLSQSDLQKVRCCKCMGRSWRVRCFKWNTGQLWLAPKQGSLLTRTLAGTACRLMANSEKNLGSMRDVANSVVKPVLVLLGYSTK